MTKGSHGRPEVGALVKDETMDRLGVYMGEAGPFAMLRPVGGGKEWETRPEDVRVVARDGCRA